MDDTICLTSDEVRRRLDKFGPNAVPETTLHPLRRVLANFWAPIPWMLEAAIILELPLANTLKVRSSRFFWFSTPLSGFSRKGELRKL
jgi:magnesium-transporting ATPase (P-type)